jgi:hypothetical protein
MRGLTIGLSPRTTSHIISPMMPDISRIITQSAPFSPRASASRYVQMQSQIPNKLAAITMTIMIPIKMGKNPHCILVSSV